MKSLDDAPFIDVFSAEFNDDPGSIIEPLREETSLARTVLGVVVINRQTVYRLLGEKTLRSSVLELTRLQGVSDGIIFDLMSNSLLATEGEAHLRLRKLVNRAFTPRAVDPHRPMMRDVLDTLLDPVIERGECEFMAEVADHYPILVMCQLLGVPAEDHERFTAWNKAATWALSFELSSHRDEAEWGAQSLSDYVVDLVKTRRAEPQDDLVTTLVQLDEAGDRLSDLELRALIGGLLFAGFDTTRNQLGLALALFAEHPDQWALLADRPDLVPQAADEVLRYRGAVGVSPRIAEQDLEVDGYLVPAGTMVSLSLAAANFDSATYENPAEFDITVRRDAPMTFGGGAHYCLGANLARAELQEALARLARVMPGLELAGAPAWRTPFGIYGPDRLPVRFGQR